MQQRIGILGGTFNPVHYGHLAASEEVLEKLGLDLVLFVPSFLPPHKQEEEIPSGEQRLEMVRLATAGNPRFMVSDIEVKRGGKSYTIDTIRSLQSVYMGSALFFITGLDSFLEIRTWNQWPQLLRLCAFVILSRPGYCFSDLLRIDFLQDRADQLSSLDRGELKEYVARTDDYSLYLETIPHHDISSTDIRNRIRSKRPVKYLLPETVERYIIKHKIYG